MEDFARMTMAGIVAILIWELLDFISPRLKVGLSAALMASQQAHYQSIGIIVILRVLWNGLRNFIRTNYLTKIKEPVDSDGYSGA